MPTELSQGFLRVFVIERTGLAPIENAAVTIVYEEAPEAEPREFTTDNSGQTPIITLPAPPLAYSEAPDEPKPYSEYTITVTKEGYEETIVTGSEILPDELSVQVVQLRRLEQPEEAPILINIPDHTLYGIYPPKIPEPEIKPLPETGEIVLSRVVIPEYVIVHDGIPSDASAPNYWVRYTDYIKNVACCEIYATWEEASILANILVIMSFTLNRVFTEFYRNQGYDFTITSSTAYDQKFMYGRNIYENISNLVDQVFNNYLARPGITQPIFTSYCDGQRVTCNGLSQWGSKFLGDEGYSAIEIIRNYYGQDMYIATAEQISGVPSSFPGYDLTIGASGDKVRQLQRQLNRIAQDYPAIPTLNVDGIYGPRTAESVRVFQRIFGLPQTGVTDFATWYAISRIYVAVARLSEPGAF